MNHKLITGALAALFASAALAQSTTPSTEHPKPIATSQQTADEASQKAAQEGAKTAAVVRTGPSAADHVGNAASKTKAKAVHTKDKAEDKAKSTTAQ